MRDFQRVTAVVVGMAALSIAPAGAQGLLTAPRISAALANEAVGAAVASCAAQGYNETAVLVDTDGVTVASLRGDNTGIHTLDSAHDKAYTAVSFKRDTIGMTPGETDVLMARLPHLLRAGGGVVIKSGTTVVGAIGGRGVRVDLVDVDHVR